MARAWGSGRQLFDLSSNTPDQRAVVKFALDHCDFPWKLLSCGLMRDAAKERITVDWRQLTMAQWKKVNQGTRIAHRVTAEGHEHDDNHDHENDHSHSEERKHARSLKPRSRARAGRRTGSAARAADATRQAMDYGWAVPDGRMYLQSRMVDQKELMAAVFLLEGAHFVDYHYMSQEQRDLIFGAFHEGRTRKHDHGWWETQKNDDYEDMVGEAFMLGFLAAFSDLSVDPDAFPDFSHDVTPKIARQIRKTLLPPS